MSNAGSSDHSTHFHFLLVHHISAQKSATFLDVVEIRFSLRMAVYQCPLTLVSVPEL